MADRACGSSGLAIARLAGASTTYVRWDGWQFGVEAGWGNFRSDFGNSTGPLVAFILRNTIQESEFAPSTWTTLPSNTTNGPVFGGYIGYNMQWDQLVLGVDLGYKYANIATGANDSISRQFVTSNQFLNTVSIDARAQMKLVDYATLRGRAGYAWGQFLPYAMVGIAAGRFNYETTVTVTLRPAHQFHLLQASLSISPTPRATAKTTPSSAALRAALA